MMMAFLLHFKDDGKKNWRKLFFFFVLSFTRCNVLYSPKLISHLHKLQSVSCQMVSRICISLLQVLSYRQLDLGMSFQAKIEKKARIIKRFLSQQLGGEEFNIMMITYYIPCMRGSILWLLWTHRFPLYFPCVVAMETQV